MANRRVGYSRFVQISKVVLPLLALGILSTLFLISRTVEISDLPLGSGIPNLLAEQAMSNPNYTTSTPGGGSVSLSGARARPDLTQPGAFEVSDVRLELQEPDGFGINLRADLGSIPADRTVARFEGNVSLSTNAGLSLETDGIEAAPDLSHVAITKPFTARLPFGEIAAGSLVLSSNINQSGVTNFTALFEGGVKLVYTPSKQ